MAKQPKINDVGEKIGGAAKDLRGRLVRAKDLQDMTILEKHSLVKKEAVWPMPNWEEMVENGASPESVIAMDLIYRRIANKPALRFIKNTPEAQELGISDYVSILTETMQAMQACKTLDDVNNLKRIVLAGVQNLKVEEGHTPEDDKARKSRAYHSLWRTRTADPLRLTSADRMEAVSYAHTYDKNTPDYLKKMNICESSRRPNTFFIQELHSNSFFVRNPNYSAESPECLLDVKSKSSPSFSKITYFVSREEAKTALQSSYAFRNDPEMAKKNKAQTEKKAAPKKIVREHLKTINRIGPEREKADISPEDFIARFGFRAAEFGEWLPDDERRSVLRYARDALSDLAEVLKIPDAAIGRGILAVGFGARGKSYASAHYEPDRHVINLTRLKGAGSLAHELFHWFDHHFFEKNHGLLVNQDRHAQMATDCKNKFVIPTHDGGEFWKEMVTAMFRQEHPNVVTHNASVKRLLPHLVTAADIEAIEADNEARKNGTLTEMEGHRISVPKDQFNQISTRSDFFKESMKSYKPDYFASNREMAARAFETYIQKKLDDMGRYSPYLVNGTDPITHSVMGPDFDPYPRGDDLKRIGVAIESLTAAAFAKDRHHAIEIGLTATREEAHALWVKNKDTATAEDSMTAAEKAAPSRSRSVSKKATPDPAPTPATAIAATPGSKEDVGGKGAEPTLMEAISRTPPLKAPATALEAALHVLEGEGKPLSDITPTQQDRANAKSYVFSTWEDTTTQEGSQMAIDVLLATLAIMRADVSLQTEKAAFEKVTEFYKDASAGGFSPDEWCDSRTLSAFLLHAVEPIIAPPQRTTAETIAVLINSAPPHDGMLMLNGQTAEARSFTKRQASDIMPDPISPTASQSSFNF